MILALSSMTEDRSTDLSVSPEQTAGAAGPKPKPEANGSWPAVPWSILQRNGSDFENSPKDQERPPSREGGFKRFLLETEDDLPLWYRLSDLYLTIVGAFCFYMTVVEPGVAEKYGLSKWEDVINVNFAIKFVLLFWANDFSLSWLANGKATLDLASCLPVLKIPARYYGGPLIEKTFDLLQLARFLRLLRDTLPSGGGGARRIRGDPLQVLTVLAAFAGTIVLSATLLFLYENPTERGSIGQIRALRTFDDAVLYMVNVFAGRDPPFYAQTPGGKQVTVAATLVGLLYVPFLISESVEVFMGGSEGVQSFAQRVGFGPSKEETQRGAAAAVNSPTTGPAFWAGVLWRLDSLQVIKLISPEEGDDLRQLALEEDNQLRVLDLRYGWSCADPTKNKGEWELYAQRLKTWLHNKGR